MPQRDSKRCSVCKDEFPLTAMYFDRDNGADDKFRSECKQCRAEKRKLEQDTAIDERLVTLDRAALNMLTMVAHQQYGKVPHVAEVFECLMRVFGGPQGYAEHFLGTYLSAKPGSPQRIKLLSIMSMLANQATQSGAVKVPKEYLNDEDLDREIEQVGMRLLKIEHKDKDVA